MFSEVKCVNHYREFVKLSPRDPFGMEIWFACVRLGHATQLTSIHIYTEMLCRTMMTYRNKFPMFEWQFIVLRIQRINVCHSFFFCEIPTISSIRTIPPLLKRKLNGIEFINRAEHYASLRFSTHIASKCPMSNEVITDILVILPRNHLNIHNDATVMKKNEKQIFVFEYILCCCYCCLFVCFGLMWIT